MTVELGILLAVALGVPAGLFVLYIAAKLVGYGYARGRAIQMKETQKESE